MWCVRGTTLLACGVAHGDVREWNEQQPSSDTVIDRLDRIVEVNGVRGMATDLFAETIAQRDKTRFVVMKYGAPV